MNASFKQHSEGGHDTAADADPPLIRAHRETRVHLNAHDEVVIYQDALGAYDEDAFVYFSKPNAWRVALAILAEAGFTDAVARLTSSDEPAAPSRTRSRSGGAARSKAYRDRMKAERAGVTRDDVPSRNTVTPTVTRDVTKRYAAAAAARNASRDDFLTDPLFGDWRAPAEAEAV